MSSSSAQPSSRVKLWILFITGFLHLHYFLLGPILHVWKISLKRPLSRSTETERWEGRRSPWHQITVVLSARPMLGIRILVISFLVLVYGHTLLICETVIAMHYPENRVKGRITNGSQCRIITASPEEHRRVKLAQRHNKQDKGRDETIQVKFTILIFRCLLLLSICLIRLHSEKVVAMGAVLAAETVICDALWFGRDNHKQSLENLALPNCQSAWLNVTSRFPSRVLIVVIYLISYFSDLLSQRLSEDMLSVCSRFSSVHL